MLYAKRYMRAKIQFVRETAFLQQICKALIKNNTSGVPVVDAKKNLIGFVSARDIVNSIARGGKKKIKARDIMTKDVISVEEDTPLEYVSKIFTEKPFRHMPVTRGGRVVGMIARKDVISNLLSHYY